MARHSRNGRPATVRMDAGGDPEEECLCGGHNPFVEKRRSAMERSVMLAVILCRRDDLPCSESAAVGTPPPLMT